MFKQKLEHFKQVFWNSRLQTEHQRIVDLSSRDDVIFDGFAGVGPFAVQLAKKGEWPGVKSTVKICQRILIKFNKK